MSEIRIQEVQEGAQLMDKLVELLTVGTKWFSDKADAADLAILDKRINERAAEGWELVTYDYMATSMQIKGRLRLHFGKRNKSNHFSSRCIILLGYNRVNDNRIKYSVEGDKNEKDIFNAAFYPGKRRYAE